MKKSKRFTKFIEQISATMYMPIEARQYCSTEEHIEFKSFHWQGLFENLPIGSMCCTNRVI